MSRGNVLGARSRLTQSSLLQAVSEVVGELSQGSTDQDMADAWGVSKSTVENARNRKHVIASLSLLGIVDRFGPEAADPIFALVGCKLVSRDGDDDDDSAAVREAMTLAHQFVGEALQYELEGQKCHRRRAKLAQVAGVCIRALGNLRRRVAGGAA